MSEELNPKQQKKIEDHFEKKSKNVDEKDIKKVVDSGAAKIGVLENDIPDALESLWQDIKDMWNMVKDYWNKKYPDVPFGTIAAIVTALLYFVSPIDVIPDFIPVVGYIDDAFIVTLALKMIGKDIEKYRSWKYGDNPDNMAMQEY